MASVEFQIVQPCRRSGHSDENRRGYGRNCRPGPKIRPKEVVPRLQDRSGQKFAFIGCGSQPRKTIRLLLGRTGVATCASIPWEDSLTRNWPDQKRCRQSSTWIRRCRRYRSMHKSGRPARLHWKRYRRSVLSPDRRAACSPARCISRGQVGAHSVNRTVSR